jgi:uncharacterized phage protein gp47/JayE
MTGPATPLLDVRDVDAVLAEFETRRHGYLPQWNPPPKSAGAAVGPIFARLLVAILQRLNQAPAKEKLAFLDLMGLRLVPAQPARAPIVFSLSAGAPDTSAPEGTQVAAPPPPGSTQQVVFSTEQDAAVAAAKLTEVVSLWPGRDQYIDHSTALAAGRPFTLFQNLQLNPTGHILYLAHSKYLAFAGTTKLKVTFDLSQGSSSPLDITWEYWDGQVWRGFIPNRATCLDPIKTGFDSTNGLSVSGSVLLEVQGAQAAQTSVNGVNSYWIRARLGQPLLPDPNQLLPEADTLRLFTVIEQDFEVILQSSFGASSFAGSTKVVLTNAAGTPLEGAWITITDPASNQVTRQQTGNDGSIQTSLALITGVTYTFTVTFLGEQASLKVLYSVASGTEVDLTFSLQGLRPDKAYAGGKTLDVTKAFLPFGPLPQPGSAFYFKQQEAFTKPGALVRISIDPIPADHPSGISPWSHLIAWEFWNGYDWVPLLSPSNSSDFTTPQIVEFTVPRDMVSTKVNNEDGLWVRVRVASGKYGFDNPINLPDGHGGTITITFPVTQAPVLADFRVSYKWLNGPFPFERVFAYNDFQFVDRTNNGLWPGTPFPPYQLVGDVTPALYLGFDKLLPVNNFGVYFDIAEQAGVNGGPALVWEHWNGAGWAELAATDGTEQLALPGMITFIPAADAQPFARFEKPLFWLRGRLKEDGPPNEITVNHIYTNAVWASQWQTYTDSPLGVSTGVPNQIFKFNQIPILPGQEIEVQELSGPRANTEWRGLAMQVVPDNPDIVTALEALLTAEGSQTDIILENVHLIRDKTKSVTAVLIQWQEKPNFFESGPQDRVYVLDHAMGRLFFGDGDTGMVPPLGAPIQATSFRSGGGLAGNVRAATVTQLLGAVSGVQSVTNPRPGEGGADGESLDQFRQRAPSSLRNRDRAIVPQDYEALALQSSAGVAVARAFPALSPSGIKIPGWVTVMIIPQSQDPRPMPSSGLRQEVRAYLLSRAPFDVAAAGGINVVAPEYLPVDVTATLAPTDPAKAGTVELDGLKALAAFFNPLTGGPSGNGWDVGRGVHTSDVAAVLGDVPGVDYVQELALFVNGVLQGDEVQVRFGQVVVAGQFKVSLVLPVGG